MVIKTYTMINMQRETEYLCPDSKDERLPDSFVEKILYPAEFEMPLICLRGEQELLLHHHLLGPLGSPAAAAAAHPQEEFLAFQVCAKHFSSWATWDNRGESF